MEVFDKLQALAKKGATRGEAEAILCAALSEIKVLCLAVDDFLGAVNPGVDEYVPDNKYEAVDIALVDLLRALDA